MDYNDFGKNKVGQNSSEDLFKKVMELAKKFDGKSTSELLKAIYEEAEKGKKNGTLTDAEIDGFRNMLYPFLDNEKRKVLDKIVRELKKI